MIITHRIPWAMPYGYTEVIQDDAHGLLDADTGQPVPFDYARAAQAARDMEAAVSDVDRLPPPPEYPDDPGPQEPPVAGGTSPVLRGATNSTAPQEPARTALDEQGFPVVVATGEKVTGENFPCPDCGRPVKESVERYQQWEVGGDGRSYPQKFFCPNDACGTKSLWRSKLVRAARVF